MIVEAAVFTCNICGEPSKDICAFCTQDACANHRCDRCKRCSDCCECDVPLSAAEAQAAEEAQAPEPVPTAAIPPEAPPIIVETEPAAPEANTWFMPRESAAPPPESFNPPEEPEQ
jgi:hypothetical protein